MTAAVDRISIISPLSHFCDLRLSGFVSYVGRSSMEISIEVRKLGELGGGESPLLLTCAFTMVALNPTTKKWVFSESPWKLEGADTVIGGVAIERPPTD